MASLMDQKAAGSSGAVPAKTKIPVNIDSFLLDLRIPFDVYSKDGSGGFACVFKKWTKFDQTLKNNLKSKGVAHLFVEGEAKQVEDFFHEKPAAKRPEEASYASYSNDKAKYHHVSRLVFVPNTRVNFSIFSIENLRFMPVLTVAPNQSAPVPENIRNISGELAIKMDDMKLYREFLFGLSKRTPATAEEARVKVAGIKEDVKMNVRDFLSAPGNAQSTQGVINSANQIISVLRRKEATISDMLTLRAKDFHLYNHSSNVAVLATAMGVSMGYDQGKIEQLAIGAIMHDVGKGVLAPQILSKKERLTNEEFASWKKHVSDGVSLLSGKGIPRESLNIVQQHHEKLSGRGYPYGLKGLSITPFARVMAIVDSYDAMVTPRPFRTVLTPFQALEIIMKETTQGDYDKDFVKLFVGILKGQGRI